MSGSSQQQKEECERDRETRESHTDTENDSVQNKRYRLPEIERNVSWRESWILPPGLLWRRRTIGHGEKPDCVPKKKKKESSIGQLLPLKLIRNTHHSCLNAYHLMRTFWWKQKLMLNSKKDSHSITMSPFSVITNKRYVGAFFVLVFTVCTATRLTYNM